MAPKVVVKQRVSSMKGPASEAGTNVQGSGGRGPRSEMESLFDRFRLLDKHDDGELMGPKGLQQLCTELSIALPSFESMVLMWRLGAVRSGCVSRAEWLVTMYTYNIESIMQLRSKLLEWTKELMTSRDTLGVDDKFTEMYFFLYDFVRGENDRLMVPQRAIGAWKILLPDKPIPLLWCQWIQSEYKQDISRDLWRQVWVLVSTTPTPTDFDASCMWPTAIDDFVAWWAQKQPQQLRDISE